MRGLRGRSLTSGGWQRVGTGALLAPFVYTHALLATTEMLAKCHTCGGPDPGQPEALLAPPGGAAAADPLLVKVIMPPMSGRRSAGGSISYIRHGGGGIFREK